MLLHGHPSLHVEPPKVAWTPPTSSRSFADDVFETVKVSFYYFKISMGGGKTSDRLGFVTNAVSEFTVQDLKNGLGEC